MAEHDWSEWYQSDAYPDTWYRYCMRAKDCCAERFGIEIEKRTVESKAYLDELPF